MAVQQLTGGALAPSAMDGGNMVATNQLAMALPGSEPITPMPETPNLLDQNLPMPKIPDEQMPLIPTAGRYDAGGEPHPSVPRSDGGFTVGVQGGGLQGHGNPGAGSSGPDLWKPTPSS